MFTALTFVSVFISSLNYYDDTLTFRVLQMVDMKKPPPKTIVYIKTALKNGGSLAMLNIIFTIQARKESSYLFYYL